MKKKSTCYEQKRLNSHYRTKSQQQYISHKYDKNYIRMSELHKKIPVQININNKLQRLYFEINTSFSTVKEKIISRIGSNERKGCFASINKDYNLDYMLHEGLGLLNKPLHLEYNVLQANIQEHNNLNSYQIGQCISVGGFSKVFLLRSKNNGQFYIGKFVDKEMSKDPKFVDLIENQKAINQILEYPFLVKMHNFIETQSFYIFVLDYCPSGQLFTLMKNNRNMSESQAKFYFIQTILAINYMHSKGIIYRDIKPENILLDKNGHVKVADFGLAKIIKQKAYSYCGSLQYMAPEIITGEAHSFAVDYYCLGSLLYEMMVGCPPFYNPNFTQNETKMHIINSSVKFPSNKQFSYQLKDFVLKLLEKDQNKRLGSLGGIKQILAHPWVGKINFKDYENYKIDPPYYVPLNQCNFEKTYLPHSSIRQTTKKIYRDLNLFNKRRPKTIERTRLKSSQDVSRLSFFNNKQNFSKVELFKKNYGRSAAKSRSQSISKHNSRSKCTFLQKKRIDTQQDEKLADLRLSYNFNRKQTNELKKCIKPSMQKKHLKKKENELKNKFQHKTLNLKKALAVKALGAQDQSKLNAKQLRRV